LIDSHEGDTRDCAIVLTFFALGLIAKARSGRCLTSSRAS